MTQFEIMMYLFIFLGILSRLVPHPANFAPITALALFGGTTLRKRDALVIPLFALLASDLFLGGFYGPVMFYVYGSFVLIGLLGLWLRRHKSPVAIITTTLFSSVLFFVVTNFGVFAQGWYGHTYAGLINTYLAALPFFRNTVLGDLFYTGFFFGGFELAKMFGKNSRTDDLVLEAPEARNAAEVLTSFSKTKKYSKAFLKDLEKGLKRSKYFQPK